MADNEPTKIAPDPVVEKAWKDTVHLAGASDDIRENRAAAGILKAKGVQAHMEGNDTAFTKLCHAREHLEAHQDALLQDQTGSFRGMLDREKTAVEEEKRKQGQPVQTR